ncbi:MAG: tyrosine--tRNA ligase [Candidatus Omnitrophica bacterium]|nr:tyrosine--tRNA ligase [Candidatus Omnitrophota bacterium]MCM8770285.1 tyrosine--tRNA ligase [Candidatus Omnitrophota bacterium]
MKTLGEQLKIIKRGTVEIISEEELTKKLERSIRERKPLIVKAGFDPTAADLHLGHTVLLRKLKQFQDLGHKVIFLIGDFTARIGDPSGRSETRKQMTKEEVLKNALTYKKQIGKILNLRGLKIIFNSKWFDKMSGLKFGELFTHYTATRLLERDDFAKRIAEKKPIYMSEFMYPLLQGYDSVMLNADIELGGTDQIFNLLVGRDLQRDFGQEPQVVITMPLLEGTDGVQKMSKSFGNYIGINEPADEMFGKLMSISDELMLKYFELLTDEEMSEIKALHPKEAKIRLAKIIVAQYHGLLQAEKAQREFERIFTKRELPSDIAIFTLKEKKSILEIMLQAGLSKTGNEARRLIKQGAVTFDNKKIDNEKTLIDKNGVLKIGTRRFLKIEYK